VSHSKMLDAYGTSTVTMAPRYNRADKILGAGEVDFWQTSLDTGNRFIGTAFQPSHSTAMRPSRGLFEGSSSLPPNRRGRLCWTRFSALADENGLFGGVSVIRHSFIPYRLSNRPSSSPPTIRPSIPQTISIPLHQLSVYPLHHYPSILSITVRLALQHYPSPFPSPSLSSPPLSV